MTAHYQKDLSKRLLKNGRNKNIKLNIRISVALYSFSLGSTMQPVHDINNMQKENEFEEECSIRQTMEKRLQINKRELVCSVFKGLKLIVSVI